MASAAQRSPKRDLEPHWRDKLADSLRRFARRSTGALLVALGVGLALAMITYSSVDPSLTTAAGGPPTNWLGAAGAYSSDLLLLLFGPAAALFLPLLIITGVRLLREVDGGRLGRAVLVALIGVLLLGLSAALFAGTAVSGLPGGWGGVLGLAAANGVDALIGLIGNPGIAGPLRLSLMALLAIAGLVLGFLALGLRPEERDWASNSLRRDPNAISAKPPRRSRLRESAADEDNAASPPRSRPAVAVTDPSKPIAAAAASLRKDARKGKAAAGQASLELGDNFTLPPLTLLGAAPAGSKTPIDRAGLERNARLLESVLEDFHVRGDIVEVRPGPVVTMYELEPASGIKASRVIQLADDIARNMSALSARVATIPGRSVIGIELPNA
ncbi:MAG: DNA translocase FtsK 4TM domain-containing protein, partial [Sphingomicrobium sp.]